MKRIGAVRQVARTRFAAGGGDSDRPDRGSADDFTDRVRCKARWSRSTIPTNQFVVGGIRTTSRSTPTSKSGGNYGAFTLLHARHEGQRSWSTAYLDTGQRRGRRPSRNCRPASCRTVLALESAASTRRSSQFSFATGSALAARWRLPRCRRDWCPVRFCGAAPAALMITSRANAASPLRGTVQQIAVLPVRQSARIDLQIAAIAKRTPIDSRAAVGQTR